MARADATIKIKFDARKFDKALIRPIKKLNRRIKSIENDVEEIKGALRRAGLLHSPGTGPG
jgi:hypothetical protein